MKIQKFNELYEQQPKDNWGSDTDKTNYYTFTCDITIRANSEEEADVYEVLLYGRQVRAKFDRKYCPLGAYLYYYFTKEGIFEDLYQGAVMYHKGELKGIDFLKKFPKNHLSDVVVGISKLATIRAEKILELNK